MDKEHDDNKPDIKTINNILNNYIQNEKALVDQLHFATSHGPTIGGFREDIWKSMFEQIVPKKFFVDQSVFIIDSEGRVSNEVDLAIYDETYTPYIFRYGRLKFIPIEAVAVVVECKSSSFDQDRLVNWANSIAALTTSVESYTRTAPRIVVGKENPNATQTQTRPLRILCCLNNTPVEQTLASGDNLFDIIIRAPESGKMLTIKYDQKKKTLKDWYVALNHAGGYTEDDKTNAVELEKLKLESYQINDENAVINLLSFNLILNQLLMLINNPIPFPHLAYAKLFQEYAKGGELNE